MRCLTKDLISVCGTLLLRYTMSNLWDDQKNELQFCASFIFYTFLATETANKKKLSHVFKDVYIVKMMYSKLILESIFH